MTPSALADRIAALDWSACSLQHQLAVTAACETLRVVEAASAGFVTPSAAQLGALHDAAEQNERDWIDSEWAAAAPGNVLPFPALRGPSPELLRGSEYNEQRFTLRRLDGSTAATTILARSERWDWIVSTVCELLSCDPSAVDMDDDTVTVDGLPVFSC